MSLSEVLTMLVLIVCAIDLAAHLVILYRHRAVERELAAAKGRNGLTVQIECDATQALEQIERVKVAAKEAAREVERLH